jgi:hypothetical protein
MIRISLVCFSSATPVAAAVFSAIVSSFLEGPAPKGGLSLAFWTVSCYSIIAY